MWAGGKLLYADMCVGVLSSSVYKMYFQFSTSLIYPNTTIFPPPPVAAEATGLGFIVLLLSTLVVGGFGQIQPYCLFLIAIYQTSCVVSQQSLILGSFLFLKFSNFTPFIDAAHNGSVKVVENLLKHDASPLLIDNEGMRAVDHSKYHKFKEITVILKKAMQRVGGALYVEEHVLSCRGFSNSAFFCSPYSSPY